MNQARTTYQSDYTPFDWLRNNVTSDKIDFSFCSSENIDECLKYISQEFCALGYPSIYSDSTDCSCAVNCDIVNFINITNELLRSNNEYMQTKEDLESRNRHLCSDLNAFNKKNLQLKNTLEQIERKLGGALERERQLKEKNEQLAQLLKSEKEETKKLSAQIRQQKVTYQHEIRKYENNMNQVKARLNQILSDKNPNKKIANISTSHILPRNTGQRGKWKTGSTATTAIEDMYNSVISSYETNINDMYGEINAFRECLHTVLLEMFEVISASEEEPEGHNCSVISKEFILNDLKNASRNVQTFEDKFKYLLSVWKKTASERAFKITRNLEDELIVLNSKVSEYANLLEKSKEPSQVDESLVSINSPNFVINKEETPKSSAEEYIKREKMKLEKEKLALSKSLENIEKEKADIAAQKVAFLRLSMQQKITPSSWHQTLNTLPSISVITPRNGESKILTSHQLKFSVSSPADLGQVPTPEWKPSCQAEDKVILSKSDTALLSEGGSATESPVFSPLAAGFKTSSSDLPSWAVQSTTLEVSHNVSSEEIEPAKEPSSEELNLLRLQAAVQDIEKRRLNIS